MALKKKYLWLTDLHLDTLMPWNLVKFIWHIIQEQPAGIFLTGDISNGLLTPFHLNLLANFIKCPIYFVIGNHDYHFSSLEKMHDKLRMLCKKHPHLIWMTESEPIPLNDEAVLIGTEGWYDAKGGKPNYLRLTFDWFMVKNFRKLPNMQERIKVWEEMAQKSAEDIAKKLNNAIDQGYKTIYILTHIPCWKEATRDVGTFLEKFWLPYNVNSYMGQALEKIMEEHKKRHAIVLSGHTHTPLSIHVSRNIECRVGNAHYIGIFRPDENILII